MKKKLLRLSDGKVGHMTTTDGVIAGLKRDFDFDIIDMQVKLRGKFLLQIMKLLIGQNWFDRCLKKNYKLLNLFYKNFTLPTEHIDLIISTGGDTSFMNIWLSRILNTKNVYCSGLRGLKPEYFHLLVSGANLDYKNLIYTEVFPNSNVLNDVSTLVSDFCEINQLSEDENYFVLMLGGNGAGYKYVKKDWIEIIDAFMKQVRKYKVKALITTSRRTGLKNEILLKELLMPYQNEVAYVVYFNQKPEKILSVFLQIASMIFVTEDSGSMIGESLYYRKPVFVISPELIAKQKKYEQFLENLKNLKRINSIKASNLAMIDLSTFDFEYLENAPMDELANKLTLYLKEVLQ